MHVIIADQESSERARLVELCRSVGRLETLTVVESGAEALKKIRLSRPEVALLACELKDMTGFDVLAALNEEARPAAAIMLAADDRYVGQTLASGAADYLTTPFSADRLQIALKRANSAAPRANRVAARHFPSPAKAVAGELTLPFGRCDRLVGERNGRIYFLPPMDVDYIEADSQYVQIHVGSERYMIRDSLTRIAALLEGSGFVRISRSILVNLHRVSFAEREGRGVLAFVLDSGARVVSSNGYRLESGAQLRIARTRKARHTARVE